MPRDYFYKIYNPNTKSYVMVTFNLLHRRVSGNAKQAMAKQANGHIRKMWFTWSFKDKSWCIEKYPQYEDSGRGV